MQLVVIRFAVHPDSADEWPRIVADLTEATRAEEGNLHYSWSRSVEDPNEYVAVEVYTDDGFQAHLKTEHFQAGGGTLMPHLTGAPKVIARRVDGDGWEDLVPPA